MGIRDARVILPARTDDCPLGAFPTPLFALAMPWQYILQQGEDGDEMSLGEATVVREKREQKLNGERDGSGPTMRSYADRGDAFAGMATGLFGQSN